MKRALLSFIAGCIIVASSQSALSFSVVEPYSRTICLPEEKLTVQMKFNMLVAYAQGSIAMITIKDKTPAMPTDGKWYVCIVRQYFDGSTHDIPVSIHRPWPLA